MAVHQLTSALLLALALSTTLTASANYIGYIAPCDQVDDLKCTGVAGSLPLDNIKSCTQVTVGCYATNLAFACGLFKDNDYCPRCIDNGDSITLKCVAKSTGSSCDNPREHLLLQEFHWFCEILADCG